MSTKAFNQAVKRNLARFPVDFMFRLTGEEVDQVSRSQIVTASSATTRMRSQSVTASKRNVRHLPYAFTEHGALQAANILNSTRAVQMNTTCGDTVGWTVMPAWAAGERSGDRESTFL